MSIRYTRTNTYDLDGNFTGIEETWTGTVSEIEDEFHVKIMRTDEYFWTRKEND